MGQGLATNRPRSTPHVLDLHLTHHVGYLEVAAPNQDANCAFTSFGLVEKSPSPRLRGRVGAAPCSWLVRFLVGPSELVNATDFTDAHQINEFIDAGLGDSSLFKQQLAVVLGAQNPHTFL